MAKRNLSNKLIDRSEIVDEIKLIPDSDNYYITKDGEIYVDYGNDKFYPMKSFINNNNGYRYCNYKNNEGKTISRRVHRLVAQTYLPNPNNYPIVLHKNNDKGDARLENLKWGTISENTQQAVNDGLLENDTGFNDSQSFPVAVFDLKYNFVGTFGSCREAAKSLGLTSSGILYQCKYKMKSKPRCGYYFRFLEEFDNFGFVL